MLKFQWRSTVDETTTITDNAMASIAGSNADLAIRDLLDDPRLRRAMTPDSPVAVLRPEPVFNRRRLLESAAT
jgi:hypothetical protein